MGYCGLADELRDFFFSGWWEDLRISWVLAYLVAGKLVARGNGSVV